MEQLTKHRTKHDDDVIDDVPEDVDASSAKVIDDAEDLLAELDALLEENVEVLADADAASEDLLTRWDEQAAAVKKVENIYWQQQDRGRSHCGC
jgi:hypothetical protein